MATNSFGESVVKATSQPLQIRWAYVDASGLCFDTSESGGFTGGVMRVFGVVHRVILPGAIVMYCIMSKRAGRRVSHAKDIQLHRQLP